MNPYYQQEIARQIQLKIGTLLMSEKIKNELKEFYILLATEIINLHSRFSIQFEQQRDLNAYIRRLPLPTGDMYDHLDVFKEETRGKYSHKVILLETLSGLLMANDLDEEDKFWPVELTAVNQKIKTWMGTLLFFLSRFADEQAFSRIIKPLTNSSLGINKALDVHIEYINKTGNILLEKHHLNNLDAAFPLDESSTCFYIDFIQWHFSNAKVPKQLNAFREKYFDDVNSIPHLISGDIPPEIKPRREVGFQKGVVSAFSYMLLLVKMQVKLNMSDIIRFHDCCVSTIRGKNLGIHVCLDEGKGSSITFPFFWVNMTEDGMKELNDREKIHEKEIDDFNATCTCKKKMCCAKYLGFIKTMFGMQVFKSDHIVRFFNMKLEHLFICLDTEAAKNDEKLYLIIDFIQYLEMCHVFSDGNLRTCLTIFYYFLCRYDLPMTILSTPKIFDAYSRAEILEDIKQGYKRYELFVNGEVESIKAMAKADFDRTYRRAEV